MNILSGSDGDTTEEIWTDSTGQVSDEGSDVTVEIYTSKD